MANVIDAFLVTLGLDGTGFVKGVKQVGKAQAELDAANKKREQDEKRRKDERDRATKQTVDGVRKVRNEVLALAAIFTAGVGIKDFISNTINSAVNLGYLSANLGMSTERIKAFQLASERAGGTQEGMVAQLRESQAAIAELSTGGGPNAGMQAFFRWGGSSKDLKDGNTYLMARAKIISELFKTDPGRAALIAQQMGIREDQFNLIKQGPEAIEALIKAQEKHAAISAKDAEAALKLRNKMLDLRDSLQQTATRVILQLAPAIEKLFAQLERGANWIAEHQDDIANWVSSAVTAVTQLVTWADKVADALGGWKNVLIGLIGIKIAGFALQLAMLATNLTAIGPAAAGALSALGKLGLVGAAGAAGYMVGGSIYENLDDKTKFDIGGGIARGLALLGVGEAQAAVDINEKGKIPTAIRPPAAAPANAQERLQFMEKKYGLPPGLLDRIWNTESGRGKNMVSAAGAQGHFQFMPATAKEYGLKDPFDFNESSEAAARKMRDLLKQYGGDLAQATAAYNFGQGNLAKTGLGGVPKETRDYVAKVAGVTLPGPAPAAPARGAAPANNTTTSEVTVESITINTKATNADDIARELKPAIEKYTYANNANTGMY